jgi:hypothetical protein
MTVYVPQDLKQILQSCYILIKIILQLDGRCTGWEISYNFGGLNFLLNNIICFPFSY